MNDEIDRTAYGLRAGPHSDETSPVAEAAGDGATVSTK